MVLGEDVQDHYTLRQLINTKPELYPIAKSYRHIEEASRDARYEGRKFEKSFLLNRILPKFKLVREHIVTFLQNAGVQAVPSVKIQALFDNS